MKNHKKEKFGFIFCSLVINSALIRFLKWGIKFIKESVRNFDFLISLQRTFIIIQDFICQNFQIEILNDPLPGIISKINS